MVTYTAGDFTYKLHSYKTGFEPYYNVSTSDGKLMNISASHITGTLMGNQIYKDASIKVSVDVSKVDESDEKVIQQIVKGLFNEV